MAKTRSKFTPTVVTGSTKYGAANACPKNLLDSFELSLDAKQALLEAGDYGLAKSTWSTYKTAEKMLAKCRQDTKKGLNLPLQETDILEFIGWLMYSRNVKVGTINSYLSGLRQMHILKGMEPPMIRSSLVKFLLKGRLNKENIKNREETKRMPITVNMMLLLKASIKEWDVSTERKLLMWSVCTMAFNGGFRIHEILAKEQSSFDPAFTLLTNDVKIKKSGSGGEMLVVKLKCPKEDRTGKGSVVEVHGTNGNLCPVKAFQKWVKKARTEEGLPLFRQEDGTPLTGAKLNLWLKDRLKNYIDPKMGSFSSHSFRSGLASSLAMGGASEETIKEAGRWSSKAYEYYIKMPQTKRAPAATAIRMLDA